MTDIHHRYATRNVPRYTSYPTAPHFHRGIGGKAYGDWLEALDPELTLSLYLHVPFCRQICHYCGCHTKGARRDAPVIAYAETLLGEIDLVLARLGPNRRVAHIHWGGGTPSLLPADAFLKIAGKLKSAFQISPAAEHAIELDPRSVTPQLVETLAMAGINRASLGVQDFDETVQQAIGRVQPYELVQRSVELLRRAGIDDLNFDLMYGLPHQTRETILKTVALTRTLRPGRIALFGYAHVPWFKKHQRLIDEAVLPGAAERIELADCAREALIDAGYEAIGLDHFALPDDGMAVALRDGRLRRNFQGYTTDNADALIGFGASSIGFLPQGYVQNITDTGGWTRTVEAGELPIAKGIALSPEDLATAAIIERLMTVYEVDIAEIAAAHAVDPASFDWCVSGLAEMIADGLVEAEGTKVRMTETGKPYVRVAAACFDAYLTAGAARHSVAV